MNIDLFLFEMIFNLIITSNKILWFYLFYCSNMIFFNNLIASIIYLMNKISDILDFNVNIIKYYSIFFFKIIIKIFDLM